MGDLRVEATLHKRQFDEWSIDVVNRWGVALVRVPAFSKDDKAAIERAEKIAEVLRDAP